MLENSSTDPFEMLSQLSLKKFYTKRLMEIELVIPLTSQDQNLLKEIIDTGKKYEHLTQVYFITQEDVLNLIERLIHKSDDIDLPKHIKENAHEVVLTKLQEVEPLSLDFFALMIKLKIIESMYKVYSAEVCKMQRRHHVDEELNGLLRDCEPKGAAGKASKKGKKDRAKKDKSSKKSEKSGSKKKSQKSDKSTRKSKKVKSATKVKKESSKTKVIVDDYTEIALDENQLIFDYNVDNQAMYFVLSEFLELHIIEKLSKIHVDISAVVDVSLESSKSCDSNSTIKELEQLFRTLKKVDYLKNTVWMKYKTHDNSSSKDNLETFLYVVKRINYIKRRHLSYIKDMKLGNIEEKLKKLDRDCLEKYNRILNSYPSELINVPMIVSALIQEICWRENGKIYSLSDLTPSSEQVDYPPKESKTYQTHEEDLLKMGMRAFNEMGRKYYEESLKYLKLLQPLKEFEHSSKKRLQNRAVSTEQACYCTSTKDLFDYFHLAIFNQMKRKKFIPKEPKEFYFTENLEIHNRVKEYEEARPKGLPAYMEMEKSKNDLIRNYHMKENLSTSVLLQMIFKAMKKYSYWDRTYCEESEAILLRFHDNLNKLGLDVRIWYQSLRTPVCVRDFCRFVASDEKEWLEKHRLVEHADFNQDDSEEECEGLKDMQVSELYEEYKYLLGDGSRGVSNEEKKKMFDEAMTELLNYPKSESLRDYCNNDSGTFLAYDLGSNLYQLTGHTTVFHSDDGVKVTVDTSRFLQENPKCAITIDADDNILVFHSTRPSAFHFICKDETIVSFTEFDQESLPVFPLKEDITEEQEVDEEQSKGEEEENEPEVPLPNYTDYWVQVLRKSKTVNLPMKESIYEKKVQLDDMNLDRLLELFKAAVHLQHPIYKISTKPSVRRLRRNSSPVLLPFVGILKRVLFKPVRKKRKIGGYSVLSVCPRQKKVPLKYDFKITLPHGLFIETLPRNKKLAEVKQSYKYGPYKEQYRIFYSDGVIVIKNFDGSLTIFRSNGDIVRLTDGSECSSVNCAKNTTYFFQNEETCPYQSSRCKFSRKMKTDLNFYEFGEIPYRTKSLLQFNGKKIDFSEDKATEKQLYYVLNEHDYHAQEVFYEREDGMKCIEDRKGKQTFQFPDGTKITASVEVEKELIHVSSKLEGWVSVVIIYTFEHPDYITVKYDQIDGSTELFLKDIVIKNDSESFVMCANKKTVVEVTSDSIMFLKTCESCDSDCICKIHIYQGPKLLEVYDSYQKYFSCDRLGNCEINSNFIKTSGNKNKCDHRWINEKQKFFILNKSDSPGTVLWRDSSIEEKMMALEKRKSVKISNYMNKLIKKQTLEFFTEIYQNFIGRFTMTQLFKHDICLSKYKTMNTEKPRVFYITYRILIEFQNLLENPEIITELKGFLDDRTVKGSSEFMLEGIKHLVNLSTNYVAKQDRLSYRLSMKDEGDVEESHSSSSVVKSIDLEKLTAQDIVNKWRTSCNEYRRLIRSGKFPPYLQSDYFQHIQSTLK